jgi:hypothetical protein
MGRSSKFMVFENEMPVIIHALKMENCIMKGFVSCTLHGISDPTRAVLGPTEPPIEWIWKAL